MPTRIGRSRKAKGLVGAVVLTASFTLMPISDTLAESGGSCGFAIGAVEGSDDFSNKSNCLGRRNSASARKTRTRAAKPAVAEATSAAETRAAAPAASATSQQRQRTPYFTVFIPAHNRANHDRSREISSVCQQTDRDFELVVVDDGSADETFEVARQFASPIADRTKLIRLDTNLGIPGARNVCLKAASGRIGAFLDSDDVWHPDFLATIRRGFEAAPASILLSQTI